MIGGIVINTFTIKAKLPSLNEIIEVSRANKYMAAQFKRDVQELIGFEIRQALAKGTLKPVDQPCEIHIDFYERTKRRDVDNIASGGSKVILDALVKNHIIRNDSRKWVRQVHCLVYDGEEDYSVVRIETCK